MKEEIQQTRLDNGLTILTDRMDGVRSATIGFFYRVGAKQEPIGLHGISHFVEHTVFKGTSRRTAKDIAIEQDRLGGNLDAFTTHEETGFAIKVIDDQVSPAFDLIGDMLTDPRFDDADLKSEQKVIVEEMKMIDDNPEELLGDIFNEAFFPGDPLGRSIAGTPETVRSFDQDRTRKYHTAVFNASNLVITAAGNVAHDQILELSAKFFSSSVSASRSDFSSPPVMGAPIILKKRNDLEQAHMIIATPLVSAVDDRRYAADILANIIGGGTSSRLWQKVREERGLAYSVGASFLAYQDCGLFSVFAGTSPDQVEEVLDIVLDEMRWTVREGVAMDELELAKQQTRASILLGLEDSAGRAAALAQSEMMYGRQISVAETLDAIDAVTREDVHQIAVDHFKTETIAFAAIGDLDGLIVDRDRLSI
ncbi:pitrilysin family protein [soil metagenome]